MAREPDFVDECYAGKDLSLLKKLTLVIPTYNRNYYLSRCLWYHAHFPFGEIIVADSSPEEKKVVNRETVEKVREMFGANVRYLEYDFPAEEYGGEIYRKWGNAVQHVETEYSLSCTDKEFLIPTTLVQSICWLEEHPDYSIADGGYYIIESKKVIYPWQGSLSLTSDDANFRLKETLDNGVLGTQFALQRAENHKLAFENLKKYGLYDLRFGEMEIELLPVFIGKTHRNILIPMSYRDCSHQYETIGIWHKKQERKMESSFSRYHFLYEYPDDYRAKMQKKLQNCLNDTFGDEPKLPDDFSENAMSQRYGVAKTRNDLLNKHNILQYIWFSLLPYAAKVKISHYFGGGFVKPLIKKSEQSKELRIVSAIIFGTDRYYNSDLVIPMCMDGSDD